jgi:8-amino-7-oxononanoate synthase
MSIWQQMQSRLDALEAADLRRFPALVSSQTGPCVLVGDKRCLCLCSNDYLCLASDERVKRAACAGIEQWGLGAGASRLVSGTTQVHRELEQALAGFKGLEDAVVTSTGWMANQAAVHTLAGPEDLVLCDKLDHASILDAARSSGATFRTYLHRDCRRVEKLLQRRRARHRRCLIVTDSLFSMDGDLAPLKDLVEIKRRYDAQLMIDEAHATGVLGPCGRGVAELRGVEQDVDVVVGTLSKALGAMGGFVAGPSVLCETLRNTSRPYIYTTAPPPGICAGVLEALRIVRAEPDRRGRLLQNAQLLRDRLCEMGVSTLDSQSQIVPVLIGPAGRAQQVSRRLLEAGFLVPAIRPPTVARGSSRLRVSLCSGHESQDVESFCNVLGASLEATR